MADFPVDTIVISIYTLCALSLVSKAFNIITILQLWHRKKRATVTGIYQLDRFIGGAIYTATTLATIFLIQVQYNGTDHFTDITHFTSALLNARVQHAANYVYVILAFCNATSWMHATISLVGVSVHR
jgi:hypothetical protein